MSPDVDMNQLLLDLEKYADHCDFFSVTLHPTDQQVLELRFDGKFVCGIAKDDIDSVEPEYSEQQIIEIRIPVGFPECQPEINWRSEIFHPNIPLDGSVSLADVGLNWNAEMTLPVICERLWDVARWAYLESCDPANSTAGNWFRQKMKIELPLDNRRFELPRSHGLNNVFSYRRKGAAAAKPPIVNSGPRDNDIVFIE